MRRIWISCLFGLCVVSFVYSQNNYVLENKYLSRTLNASDFLHTTEIVNKQANIKSVPVECDEFILRFSEGTDQVGTDLAIERLQDRKQQKI